MYSRFNLIASVKVNQSLTLTSRLKKLKKALKLTRRINHSPINAKSLHDALNFSPKHLRGNSRYGIFANGVITHAFG
jgi:hypothetical protein